MKSELTQDIQEQSEERNVIFDSDGIVYLSCYKHRETNNIELMYADFFMRIHAIETEIWKSYTVKDTLIALTSNKNFRDKLTDKWKAYRKDKPEAELDEKQLEAQVNARKLRDQVKEVKKLLAQRLNKSLVIVSSVAEADDICIDRSKQGWLVVAMDSDVINQSRSPTFNYHKKHWKWEDPNDEEDVFKSIVHLSITSGHNGKFGVKGKGKVFATKFIDEVMMEKKTFNDYVDLFPTPEEALLNFRLASCGQVSKGKLTLVGIEDIAEGFDEYMKSPF